MQIKPDGGKTWSIFPFLWHKIYWSLIITVPSAPSPPAHSMQISDDIAEPLFEIQVHELAGIIYIQWIAIDQRRQY